MKILLFDAGRQVGEGWGVEVYGSGVIGFKSSAALNDVQRTLRSTAEKGLLSCRIVPDDAAARTLGELEDARHVIRRVVTVDSVIHGCSEILVTCPDAVDDLEGASCA
jgi:hypothetical protein